MKKTTGIFWIILFVSNCLCSIIANGQTFKDTTLYKDSTAYNQNLHDGAEEEDDTTTDDTDLEAEKKKPILPIVKKLSKDSIALLKKDKGFAYMVFLDSLLKAEQDQNKNTQVEAPREDSNTIWDSVAIKVVFWVIAIGVVSFLLFKLFKGQANMFRSNKQTIATVVDDTDTISGTDLNPLLQKAIKAQNYRLAVRYLFLTTLHNMGEKGIVQLSSEKTNHQYASEIVKKSYANSFARLSLQYEYVWFGKTDINYEQFENIQNEHQQFLAAI